MKFRMQMVTFVFGSVQVYIGLWNRGFYLWVKISHYEYKKIEKTWKLSEIITWNGYLIIGRMSTEFIAKKRHGSSKIWHIQNFGRILMRKQWKLSRKSLLRKKIDLLYVTLVVLNQDFPKIFWFCFEIQSQTSLQIIAQKWIGLCSVIGVSWKCFQPFKSAYNIQKIAGKFSEGHFEIKILFRPKHTPNLSY